MGEPCNFKKIMARVNTDRIRIELTFGALTVKALKKRCGCGKRCPCKRCVVWPLVSQMRHRTKEIVRIPGKSALYTLRRNYLALAEVWK